MLVSIFFDVLKRVWRVFGWPCVFCSGIDFVQIIETSSTHDFTLLAGCASRNYCLGANASCVSNTAMYESRVYGLKRLLGQIWSILLCHEAVRRFCAMLALELHHVTPRSVSSRGGHLVLSPYKITGSVHEVRCMLTRLFQICWTHGLPGGVGIFAELTAKFCQKGVAALTDLFCQKMCRNICIVSRWGSLEVK